MIWGYEFRVCRRCGEASSVGLHAWLAPAVICPVCGCPFALPEQPPRPRAVLYTKAFITINGVEYKPQW